MIIMNKYKLPIKPILGDSNIGVHSLRIYFKSAAVIETLRYLSIHFTI